MATPKRTPLYPLYAKYGGRIVEYAGWELPVQFAGIGAEHRAVRTAAGLFDVSHMGELRVTGRDALAFLQYLLPNDCGRLVPGKIMYSPMCYPDGGTVDDLLVHMLAQHEFLLVVNAANTDKDLAWLLANAGGYAVLIEDISAHYAQLALQGPAAAEIMAALGMAAALELKRYWFLPELEAAGCRCLVARTGYTGEDGFELYAPPDQAARLWEAIMAQGRAVPTGLGARDTLRLEAGMPLYGHELSPSITPVEAGLTRFIAAGKQHLGYQTLAGQAAAGAPRLLIGLELMQRAVPRADYAVIADGRQVGHVTSGTLSPLNDRPIAMALVEAEAAASGCALAVAIRDKAYPARRVELPFYNRGNKARSQESEVKSQERKNKEEVAS